MIEIIFLQYTVVRVPKLVYWYKYNTSITVLPIAIYTFQVVFVSTFFKQNFAIFSMILYDFNVGTLEKIWCLRHLNK